MLKLTTRSLGVLAGGLFVVVGLLGLYGRPTIANPIEETAIAASPGSDSGLTIVVNTSCLLPSVHSRTLLISVKATAISCLENQICKGYEQTVAVDVADLKKKDFTAEITLSLNKIKKTLATETNNTLVSVGLCEETAKGVACASPELHQLFRMRGNHFEAAYGQEDVAIRITTDSQVSSVCNVVQASRS